MSHTPKTTSGSLCPAMASAGLLGDKWTLLILREMFLGTSRFSRFQKALPRMSPSILSKRLKALEAAEIIVRPAAPSGQSAAYKLTRSGRELGPIIENMAIWGLRWRSRSIVDQDCDVGSFMWDFHRTLRTQALRDGETVILVQISDRTDLGAWWLIANDATVDLCTDDPGHDVDVYVTGDLAILVALWMGDICLKDALQTDRLFLDGPRDVVDGASEWFPISPMVEIRPYHESVP